MSNILVGFKVFFNFLSFQIKSDDIPLEMAKANKSVKMRTQILLKLFDSMFLSGKMRKNHNVQHVK